MTRLKKMIGKRPGRGSLDVSGWYIGNCHIVQGSCLFGVVGASLVATQIERNNLRWLRFA